MSSEIDDFQVSKNCLYETMEYPNTYDMIEGWEAAGCCLLPENKDDPILDLGCADGVFLRALREHGYTNLTGVEPNIQSSDFEGIKLLETDGVHMNFPEKSFNRVYSRLLFDGGVYPEQSSNIQGVMAGKIMRVLKNHGIYANEGIMGNVEDFFDHARNMQRVMEPKNNHGRFDLAWRRIS